MKVLVTGGTGVVGLAAINSLVRRGHTVRLLSRRASEFVEQWPSQVEAFPGDVTDADALRGSADGCAAILHIAGLVRAESGERTLAAVNVQGTRNVLSEAERAGARRFVFISSLGADRGSSDYHRSKFEAEQYVRGFTGSFTIVRLGNVYGPGDPAVSLLLKMVRTLPVVPVIDSGDQPFQPVWHEDAGEALALLTIAEDTPNVVVLAGRETTTPNDLLDRFGEITDRRPARLPLPSFLANLGAEAAEALGLTLPISSAALTMLVEENGIRDGDVDALELTGVKSTPLATGLAQLADALPETTPDDGVGALNHRRIWIDIANSKLSADALFEQFRANFNNFVPVDAEAEPGSSSTIEEGQTITLALPLRGNIQVRAEHAADNEITLATLEGHPLAGFVHFRFVQNGASLRFEIDVYDRAANLFDRIGLLLGGNAAQRETWRVTAERVLEVSGGESETGVQHKMEKVDAERGEHIERFAKAIIQRRKRREQSGVS